MEDILMSINKEDKIQWIGLRYDI